MERNERVLDQAFGGGCGGGGGVLLLVLKLAVILSP
jgi:hypothetical protein